MFPLIAGGFWLSIRAASAVVMPLDRLFFPQLRSARVRRPIVLVGNPRTGTTFLQRFLCEHGYGAGLEVYRMVYPSLLMQAALRPFLPILEAVAPTRYHKTKAHETSLQSVETDDVAVLFRYFDGFFLYGFFLAFDEVDHQGEFTPALRDTSARDFEWLDTLWRRSLVAHDSEVVIAKLFSLGTRLPEFLQRFPDARILYMARDPVATIPSGMSLVTGVLDNAFGFWSLPAEIRSRWFSRLYAGLIQLQRRFHDDWKSKRIPNEQVFVIPYDRMMSDFGGLMDDVHRFLGVDPTASQRDAIRRQAQTQQSYISEHSYDLAKFELDEATIRKDCAFFYEAFLPTGGRKSPQRSAGQAHPPAPLQEAG